MKALLNCVLHTGWSCCTIAIEVLDYLNFFYFCLKNCNCPSIALNLLSVILYKLGSIFWRKIVLIRFWSKSSVSLSFTSLWLLRAPSDERKNRIQLCLTTPCCSTRSQTLTCALSTVKGVCYIFSVILKHHFNRQHLIDGAAMPGWTTFFEPLCRYKRSSWAGFGDFVIALIPRAHRCHPAVRNFVFSVLLVWNALYNCRSIYSDGWLFWLLKCITWYSAMRNSELFYKAVILNVFSTTRLWSNFPLFQAPWL